METKNKPTDMTVDKESTPDNLISTVVASNKGAVLSTKDVEEKLHEYHLYNWAQNQDWVVGVRKLIEGKNHDTYLLNPYKDLLDPHTIESDIMVAMGENESLVLKHSPKYQVQTIELYK